MNLNQFVGPHNFQAASKRVAFFKDNHVAFDFLIVGKSLDQVFVSLLPTARRSILKRFIFPFKQPLECDPIALRRNGGLDLADTVFGIENRMETIRLTDQKPYLLPNYLWYHFGHLWLDPNQSCLWNRSFQFAR